MKNLAFLKFEKSTSYNFMKVIPIWLGDLKLSVKRVETQNLRDGV